MGSQSTLKENYEFGACCSFSNGVFHPYHVSDPVLGAGKTDTTCPLRNELLGGIQEGGGDYSIRCIDGEDS